MAVCVEYNRPFGLENEQDMPFFFPSEKEDGNDSENYSSTVPTMDIWKKFELLPTPPRSPSRTTCPSPIHSESSSVADTLQIVSQILDDDDSIPQAQSDKNPLTNSANLKSKLIQDCMWNSLAYEDLKVLSCPDDLYDTPCSTPPPVEYVSSDCVDPTTVFPYPMNDTQSFCSSQSSDSEEDEEIDVVTIEKPKRKLSVSSTEEPPVKRVKPVAVRAKSHSTHSKFREVKKQSSSGSDEEDSETKRATHNVLERKRRNDLKTSFHQLRAEVPEIESNERSPKVVILKKAKDYVEQLKLDEARLRKELDKENKKNKELLNKLSALARN